MRGYTHGLVIVPSDTVPPAKPVQALWVGGTGNVSVVLSGDTAPTLFTAVPAGALLEVAVKFVRATATTATLMVGLSE